MLTVTTTLNAQGVQATTRNITLPVGGGKESPSFNPLEYGLVFLGG